MSVEETASQFFGAVESGNVDALDKIYDTNLRVWHSFSDAIQSKDDSIEMLRLVCTAGSVKYEVLERHIAVDRLIQRHNVHFTSKTGEVLVLPAAIFITVDNGRITAIDEYVDGAQTNKILSLGH